MRQDVPILSNLLEPGQVLIAAPTATPIMVWAPEVPPGPVTDGLCRSWGPLRPSKWPDTHLYS